MSKKMKDESDERLEALNEKPVKKSARARTGKQDRMIRVEEERSKRGRLWIWLVFILSVGLSYFFWKTRGY